MSCFTGIMLTKLLPNWHAFDIPSYFALFCYEEKPCLPHWAPNINDSFQCSIWKENYSFASLHLVPLAPQLAYGIASAACYYFTSAQLSINRWKIYGPARRLFAASLASCCTLQKDTRCKSSSLRLLFRLAPGRRTSATIPDDDRMLASRWAWGFCSVHDLSWHSIFCHLKLISSPHIYICFIAPPYATEVEFLFAAP